MLDTNHAPKQGTAGAAAGEERDGFSFHPLEETAVEFCNDPVEWDAIVSASDSWIYQSWGWGELRRGEGWTPWRVVVRGDKGTRLGLQILERKIPFLPASVMYASRPPRPTETDVAAWECLVKWLRSFLRKRRAVLLRIDPEILDSDEAARQLTVSLGFRPVPNQEWSAWGNLPRSWMIVDIGLPEDAVFRGMRENHRRLVRKAEKAGAVVDVGTDVSHVADLHQMLVKSAKRQQFIVRDLNYFFRLRAILLKDQQGAIFIARHEGAPVAAIVCARFGRSCYYLYGGFEFGQHELKLTHILHWRAIQWAKNVGCTEYNMIGSGTRFPPVEGNSGFNLYNFKKGFGAELCYYAGYYDLTCWEILYSGFRLVEKHANRALYAGLRRMVQLCRVKP